MQINAQADDAVPELLPEPHHTAKTVELCGEPREGMRCVRSKGHHGNHEALTLDGPQRWG